ncbi:hypothetical protein D1AOALGA4SA_3175, partial [Olavius algarvensis Delta 1 endosymbiont]
MRMINICCGIMICLLIGSVFGCLPDVQAQTTSGALTSNETWSGDVFITGDVTVPSGITLIVEPGTSVQFIALYDDQGGGADASRSELIVAGSLIAEGTADNRIVFTSSSAEPAAGDWYGIRRLTGSADITVKFS